MEKKQKIYEGKAKILFETDSSDFLIQYFKDETTCFNAAKRGVIRQKGVMNNKITAKIFEYLESCGVSTHYEKLVNDREMLIKKVEIIPIEVIIRNRAAGSMCTRLGIIEDSKLDCSVLEYCLKSDALSDPLVNEYHIRALRLATDREMAAIKDKAFLINNLLTKFFLRLNLELIDFKVEFGRFHDQLIVADEISPDTCRLRELETGEHMDKDRFRQDLGHIEEAYQEVLSRVSR